MLAVSRLTVEFGGFTLFNDISYNINPKERIGLIGKNGAGKSTMLKIVAGQNLPTSGNISKPKEYKLGYLPQEGGANSDVSVFKETESAFQEIEELNHNMDEISKQLAEREDYESDSYLKLIETLNEITDRLNLLGSVNVESAIEQTLMGLGFERRDFIKPVKNLSGGWQMRIELAKILLQRPDLILLDEPTNHLDIESIVWLEEFLTAYEGAVLIVSHDRRFLDNVSNRTIEITAGRIYDLNFPYSKFMIQRDETRRVQLNAKKNQEKQIKQMEDFASKYRAKARQASRVQSKLKAIDKIDRIEIDDIETDRIKFHFPEPPRSSRVIVDCEDLTKSYGDKLVLDNIDFVLEREQKVAFVGRNGEGKSTLAKVIAGFTDITNGRCKLGGASINMGFYAQHQAELMEGNQTVFDVIDNAAKGDIRTQIRNLLGAFLFSGDDVYKKVAVLSGGEKSRLALCHLLLEPYNFLILDEPTNHLDMNSKDILKEALQNFSGAVIIISHDREFLEGLTDRTIEFKNKKVKEYLGDINYFLESKKIQSIQDIEFKDKVRQEKNNSENQPKKNFSQDKQFQRAKQKIIKQIEINEELVVKLEEDIQIIENNFSDLELHKNPDKMRDMQIDLDRLKNELTDAMSEWETSNNELEKLEENGV
ncbi:ATP-binding cassette domain-containing protein [Candidatus Kapabacteria bacterium]|nr:ATP-binding cassette domain-containing protein [Candidatus Kapabacteria bacterium]